MFVLVYDPRFHNRVNMNLGTKLVIYMILVSNCEQNVTTSRLNSVLEVECMKDARATVKKNNFEKVLRVLRVRRQDPVVQPEWTSDDGLGNLFQDYNVRVTDRKLQETEALREMIQETVDEGTYVVELDESDFKNSEADAESNPELGAQPEDKPGIGFEQLFAPEPQAEPEPVLEPEPITEPEPVFDLQMITEPEPLIEPEPVPNPEPVPDPKPIIPLQPKPEPRQELAPAPKPVWKPKLIPEFKHKPAVISKPKQKLKKINKFPGVTPFAALFKKPARYDKVDQVGSSLGKWWGKICVQPWCKNGFKMRSVFI